MKNHTPGPWAIEHIEAHDLGATTEIVHRPKGPGTPGIVVAQVWKTDDNIPRFSQDESAKANASLIAAAPELLEAGKLMLAFWDDLAKSNPGFMGKLCLQDYSRWNMALLKLPAAIAKAEAPATRRTSPWPIWMPP